ncbi:MAG: N-formylglutamate amidohydrolase [Kiloniellales bacterium]
MDARVRNSEACVAPCAIFTPGAQAIPLVAASPHSGRDYPEDFIAAARLDPLTLRRSEDGFVDELFAAAPRCGAPLLCALFPRAFLDVNREPYELDPGMFEDRLPTYVNTRSPRVSAGLGTIPRVVANGHEIYPGKLSFREAERRVETLYRPYHEALEGLVGATLDRFGHCILVDCHSMPSVGSSRDRDNGHRRVDFVLGDAHGTACAPAVTDLAETILARHGYLVARNNPYAGGFTTLHYGRPRRRVHALQIEINRGLYMDEQRIGRNGYFAELIDHLGELIAALGALDKDALAAG